MIRRPLYYVAAAFAATILLKYYFGWAVVGICCVVLAGAARWKRSGLVLLLLCAGLVSAGTLAWHEHLLKADPALDFLDQGVRLTGIVKEPALHTDSRGQVAVRIETAVREIEGPAYRSRRGTGRRRKRTNCGGHRNGNGRCDLKPAPVPAARNCHPRERNLEGTRTKAQPELL